MISKRGTMSSQGTVKPLSTTRRLRWAFWGILTTVAACGGVTSVTPSGGETSTDQVGDPGTGTSSGTGTAGDGLPCDITTILSTYCVSCHSSPPVGGAPTALLTYTDLTAPAKSDATKTMAEVSVARMKSSTSPMPPKPGSPVAAADIATFEAWVAAGSPQGTCGDVETGPNPFDAPAQCTSNSYYPPNGNEGAGMSPGQACNQCHLQQGGEAPIFSIAGTVYPTAHEPDDCYAKVESGPAISTAVVEITDKNGGVHTIKVNSVGNFLLGTSIAKPYTAKVKYDGRERIMVAAQTSGDCNSCHTQNGTKDAPGRVLLP
jgi:hypothetical protein